MVVTMVQVEKLSADKDALLDLTSNQKDEIDRLRLQLLQKPSSIQNEDELAVVDSAEEGTVKR